MISGLLLTLPLLALFLGFPESVIGILTSHPDAIETAVRYLPWLVPVLGIGALAYIYDGLFLGLTAGRSLRNAMLISLGDVPARWRGLPSCAKITTFCGSPWLCSCWRGR